MLVPATPDAASNAPEPVIVDVCGASHHAFEPPDGVGVDGPVRSSLLIDAAATVLHAPALPALSTARKRAA